MGYGRGGSGGKAIHIKTSFLDIWSTPVKNKAAAASSSTRGTDTLTHVQASSYHGISQRRGENIKIIQNGRLEE